VAYLRVRLKPNRSDQRVIVRISGWNSRIARGTYNEEREGNCQHQSGLSAADTNDRKTGNGWNASPVSTLELRPKSDGIRRLETVDCRPQSGPRAAGGWAATGSGAPSGRGTTLAKPSVPEQHHIRERPRPVHSRPRSQQVGMGLKAGKEDS